MAPTPKQPYQELKTVGAIELRFYPKALMASVTSQESTYAGSSNRNFGKLASYIFGSNDSKTKIAMTAPVHMNFQEGKTEMSFVMPPGFELKNLPNPLNKEVRLHEAEAEYVAALRFGGYASDDKINEKKIELQEALKKLGIVHTNNIRFFGYNAPWDFLLRRNEVIVSISKEDALR